MAKNNRQRPVEIEDGAKQQYHPDCILDLTIDFAPWCPSGVQPDGKYAPWRRCKYCYAAGNKLHYPVARIVDPVKLAAQLTRKLKRRAAQGLLTRCLRLGKKMDCGHPIFRPQLIAVLRACARAGLPPVIPSKFLEFDEEVAALMVEANAVYMPSLGADSLEPGAVLFGMPNGARIEAGLEYQAAGVITAPFVLLDPTKRNGGPVFKPIVTQALRSFDRVQLLPIRLRNKALARQVLGGWDELVVPGPHGQPPKFEAAKNDTRTPLVYHPSITAKIGNNNGAVRMCAHNSQQSHCGACFVPGQVGSIKTPAQPSGLAPLAKAEIAPVDPIISAITTGARRPS